MTFAQQAVLTVLDKFVIAVLVLVIGMYASRALERYKAREAFIAGYTAKHISAISDAWRLMYSWEDFVRRSFRRQRIYTDEQWHALMDDLGDAVEESQRRELAVRDYVESNRFWLGERLYGCLVVYHNELARYVHTVLYGTYAELERLRNGLTTRKQDIMTLLRVNRKTMY